jgi:hypothetical protein
MTPDGPLWHVLVALTVLGAGSSFLWAPLSTTANRNLPMRLAGAGAGVYNANRQVGAVLGSAAIAVLIDARLTANGLGSTGGHLAASGQLPSRLADAFSTSMSQARLLVPAVLACGLVAVLFFERPSHFSRR